jgi:peptidoglycan glycosyltransferase
VAAGVANDGLIMEPHVVDEIRDGEGELVRRLEPTVWRRAVSAQTAETMREAMRQVVSDGSATRLQIPGVDVGAKTGTAQFGPAAPLRSHAWVIAWAGAPGQKPSVVVAVLVEGQDGASEQTGGRVAAPIAKQVIEAALAPPPPPPADSTTTTAPGGGG